MDDEASRSGHHILEQEDTQVKIYTGDRMICMHMPSPTYWKFSYVQVLGLEREYRELMGIFSSRIVKR